MYYYYYLVAKGIRVPWKKWVTRFQIVQFFADLGFIYFAVYTEVAYRLKFYKACMGHCSGHPLAAFCGLATISSYLVLFIVFYHNTYKKNAALKMKAKAAAATKGNSSESSKNADLKRLSKSNASIAEVKCNNIVTNLYPISSGLNNEK